ncbi:MAG: penicillin-binding transpeptidase domain-containing protein, partial [Oscillospiraceae bacterium]
YPYGDIASAVLGFVNFDGNGAVGIEAYYNKILSGTPGQITSIQNGKSKDMPYRYQELYEAQDGNSIVLTIDATIQEFLERELETAIIEFGVRDGATGIVMDTKTGEILAMASMPDFDPNDPQTLTDKLAIAELEEMKETAISEDSKKEYQKKVDEKKQIQWKNRVVSEPYEPGSVFKLITAAGAIDCGAVSLNSSFYCAGHFEVAGRKIHCWKLAGHGQQSFTQAVQNSCNPAFIQIGQKMGAENFYHYFDAFGLTQRTGIDLPSEAESIYHSKKNLGIAQLSSSAFGQTFKVTPIQLISGVSAAVSGGKLMQPFVVKQVVDAEGNIIEVKEPVVKRQAIPEEVSKVVAELGRAVVDGGSGRRAGVLGYEIGGKTGTSEKLDLYDENGVRIKEHILSFLGFAPANDPQVAILVTLDDPSLANVYGSSSAAPVVGAVFKEVLPYLGIEPSTEKTEKEIRVPYLLGQKP